MKIHVKTYALLSACLALLIVSLVPTSTLAQNGADGWLAFADIPAPQPPTLTVHSADARQIDLVAGLPGCETESLTVAGQAYTRLFGAGYGYSTDLGLPNVPVMRQRVEIPFGANVTLEILSADYVDAPLADLGLSPIYPTQPQVVKAPNAQAPFTFDAAFYANGALYPATPVTLGDVYVVRGHRIQTLNIAPVAYDPGAGTLRLYKSLSLRLHLSGSNAALTRAKAERYASAAFDATLSREVLNYNQGRPLPATKLNGGYLIITADAYEAAMQPFVALKQSQGFNVTMTPLSNIANGGTTAGIKAYIQNAYDAWPTPPSYILLVGDTNTVPGWTGQDATEITDLYYATMDGASDWHPDIGRGRFPVRSAAQTTAMVDKYLAYAGVSEEDWLDWASFIGTCDSGNYQTAEGTHNYVIDAYTEPEGYTGTFPNNPQPGGDKLYCITHDAEHADVVAAVNEGRVMVIYSGHGGHDGWEIGHDQSDVRAITSYGVFPFVASHACVTNDFEETEVFGETWVLQQNKGALVYWGSADNSLWGPDDTLERAMFDALFDDGPQPDVAAMTDYGLAETELDYPGEARYYWETYNVLGDPALKVFLEPEIPTFNMAVTPTEHSVCNADPTGSSATVAISSILNYANTVTLLAGATPAGVSATFTPASAVAPFTAALDLTVGAGAPQGDHTFVITATDSTTNTKATPMHLRVVNAVAAAPDLVYPAAGASGVARAPSFTWDAAPLASDYNFQLSASPLFSDPDIDVQALPGAQYSLATPLAGGTCYWWRAQTENACGASLWATPFHFATLALEDIVYDDMESGGAGWVHAATTGSDGWALVADDAHSPTHAWHVPDADVTTDSALRMSAPVVVGDGSQLHFWHHYAFEGDSTFYDGGMLEISTNGGATWSDMGAHIIENGYTGALGGDNPNAGRQAWVADLDVWTEVIVDLSAFAGQSVQMRWRLSCDGSVGDDGWTIDDVQITAPLPPNPAPILDAITPAGGTPFVDTPVQLTGSGFTGAPNVLLAGPDLTPAWLISVTLVNSTTIDAVAPADLDWGTYTVTLFNGDCQQAVLPEAFTLLGTCDVSPTVTLASPGATELDEAPAFHAVATGTYPLRYTWDFGGAGAGSALRTATPTFYYDEPGEYTVVVTATDPCGASAVATTTVEITCNAPTVSLTAGAATVELGHAQRFTATTTGTGPLAYVWNFGGQGTGTGLTTATPSFTYAAAGVYTATVTVTGPCGVDTDTVVVAVTCDAPAVTIAVDAATVAIGQIQHFTATTTGTGPFTYAWDFAAHGGGTGFDTATPSFTYAVAGVYTATVVVVGPCGADTAIVVITATCDAPAVTAAVDAATVEIGHAQRFTATAAGTGPFTYAWNFGGQGTGTGLATATPSFTYAAAGVYTATVTVTGRCGADTDIVVVEVTCDAPAVTAAVDAATVELGRAQRFTATTTGTGPFSYAWDFGGQGTGTGLTTATPSFTYAAAGVYTAAVTVTGPCGADTNVVVVETICAATQVAVTADTTSVEPGETVHLNAVITGSYASSYVWDFGGSAVVRDRYTLHPAVTYNAPGVYTITFAVVDVCSSVQKTLVVEVVGRAPQVVITGTHAVAMGTPVQLLAVVDGAGPFTYAWDFGGDGTGGGLDSVAPTFTYAAPGVYTVSLTVGHAGDPVVVYDQVLVYQPLTGVAIAGSTLVATGEDLVLTAETLPLTATQPITFIWDNGAIGASAVYSWTEAGAHTVAVTATNGYGTQTAAFNVTTFDAVRIVSLDSDGPVTLGSALHITAVLTGAAPYTYTWDFGGAGSGVGLDTATPVYTYTAAGNYTLTLTATHAYPAVAVRHLVVTVRTDAANTLLLPLVLRH